MKLRIVALSALAALSLFGCKTVEPEKKPDPIVIAAPPPPPKEKAAEELFAEGVIAFDAQKWDDAAALFGKALAKNPSLLNAQFNLGIIAEKRADLAGAQEAYERANALDAKHKPTLLNLGKIYRLQGQFQKAVALYEKALAEPGNEYDVALLNNLTVAYRLQKDYAKAEATARKVLSRTKDNPDAYKNLALIYYDQGNYRLAEFISNNARKLDDKDPGVYNNLGMIFLKMDERARALAQFQKAVSLNAAFAPGHMNLGAMALQYRDYESAEKSFSKAVALDPTSFEGHLFYAYAMDGQKGRDPKKGPAAGAEFEKVLSLRPDNTEAVCAAGWAYAADKSGWDKAMVFLDRCKAQGTTTPQAAQMLDAKMKTILAMQKSGQPQPAADTKKEAPKANPAGASLLDKVSAEAAQQEGTEATPAPALPAPLDGSTPAPAPAPTPAPSGN